MKSLTKYITESLKTPTTLIWIDDLRNPEEGQWKSFISQNFNDIKFDNIVWCKDYDEFVDYLDHHGRPDAISFDHDLGDTSDDEKSGYSCCKYLIDWLQDHDLDIPEYAIQSSNPAGADNIKGLMDNWRKFFKRTHNSVKESIQGLDGYTDDEVCQIIWDFCEEQLEDMEVEVEEIWLHGSRVRGTAREDSDLDAVMFYKGHSKEDSVFNVLHEEECMIEDFEIDINPVQITSKHDIDVYKKKSYKYDQDILNNK